MLVDFINNPLSYKNGDENVFLFFSLRFPQGGLVH